MSSSSRSWRYRAASFAPTANGARRTAPRTAPRPTGSSSRMASAAARPERRAHLRLRLFAGAVQRLDGQRRVAGFLGDLAILLRDDRACGLVAVEAAQHVGGHLAVGALRAVLIED